MQESLLVQRMRASESRALRQQTLHFEISAEQVWNAASDTNSVEFPEPITTDGQTFDRF
jgi:hypothetical protein